MNRLVKQRQLINKQLNKGVALLNGAETLLQGSPIQIKPKGRKHSNNDISAIYSIPGTPEKNDKQTAP
jgi:hypothetical protein